MLRPMLESMSVKVLLGFEEHLGRIEANQFESYVFTISARDLVLNFIEILERSRLVFGKVHPLGVESFKYHFKREDFSASNFVAIKGDEQVLISSLAGSFNRGG